MTHLMGDPAVSKRLKNCGPALHRIILCLLLVGLATALTFVGRDGYRAWLRFQFYRTSHHEDEILLWSALRTYRDDHDGCYPHGKETADACLCLLYPSASADVLRGPYVSVSQAQGILDSKNPLLGSACRWQYTPGLTANDDPRLALAWEKEARPDGTRAVVCGLELRRIPLSEWPAFLAEQEQLLSQRDEAAKKAIPVLSAKVRLPFGKIVDRYPGWYILKCAFEPPPGQTNRWRQDLIFGDGCGVVDFRRHLEPNALRFFSNGSFLRYDGSYTLTLMFSRMTSTPVRVELRAGRCTPHAVVFEMGMRPRCHITHRDFELIRNGMSEKQVTALLGPVYEHPFRSQIRTSGSLIEARLWCDGPNWIKVSFDNDKAYAKDIHLADRWETLVWYLKQAVAMLGFELDEYNLS